MNKNNKKYVIILLLILVAALGIYYIFFNNNTKKETNNIRIVTSYNDFYTVNSCLYRLITYIYNKDVDSLSLVIDKNYLKNNNIDKSNILSILPSVDEISTFVSRKMYQEKINDNIVKYYVSGYIEVETFDGLGDRTNTYFIVYLDSNHKTFSIEPYDGEVFIGGIKNG